MSEKRNCCPQPGCKISVPHTHDARGRIVRESIDWEYLDSLSDGQMRKAIGGDIGSFINSLTKG